MLEYTSMKVLNGIANNLKRNNMTVVEWFKKELEEYGSSTYLEIDWETFDQLCEQAKEMEEQQKREEYLRGYKEGINSGSAYYPD